MARFQLIADYVTVVADFSVQSFTEAFLTCFFMYIFENRRRA